MGNITAFVSDKINRALEGYYAGVYLEELGDSKAARVAYLGATETGLRAHYVTLAREALERLPPPLRDERPSLRPVVRDSESV